jgi:hypothetical protein
LNISIYEIKTCLTPVVTTNTYDSLLEKISSVAEENKKILLRMNFIHSGTKVSSCSIYLYRTVNAKPGIWI